MGKTNKTILCISTHYVPKVIGGGEITTHEFMKHLAACGYRVKALCFYTSLRKRCTKPASYTIDKVRVRRARFDTRKEAIERTIARNKPDVIYTYTSNYDIAFLAAKAGVKHSIPVVLYEMFYRLASSDFYDVLENKANPRYVPLEGFRTANMAAKIVVTSPYLQKVFKKYLRLNSTVIYPPVDYDRFRPCGRKNRKDYITMINPHIAKGLETFLYIASKMPEKKFLIVGTLEEYNEHRQLIKRMIRRHSNVRLLPFQQDMASVYGRSKLVLFPSIIDETFGRIPLEAMAAGVPVIGRGVGNVATVIDEAGLLVSKYALDIEWVRKVKRLLIDKQLTRHLIEKGYEQIKKYDYCEQLDAMKRVIKNII